MVWTATFNKFLNSCKAIDLLADVCDWAVFNILVEGVVIDVSAAVVINRLSDVMVGVGVEMLTDGVFIVVVAMAALEFITKSGSLQDSLLFCWAAFRCWPTAVLDCVHDLQVRIPSYHVWSSLLLPAFPQFPNQEPPWPQQLILPDLWMVPHLWHTELMIVVVAAGVYMRAMIKDTKERKKTRIDVV